MSVEISVVIPTHDRAALLRGTLRALAVQTIEPVHFEVIVVADGCRDDTARVVRAHAVPYRLRLVEQPTLGAAPARNRGATEAQAPLLLFLDDDMEAVPGLIAAHLEAHARVPGGVVLGHMPVVIEGRPEDLLAVEHRAWWSDVAAHRARPEHRYTFRDLCSGNVSLPRNLFWAAGGFDEAFGPRAAEDAELGVRLMQRRVPFRFARAAESWHHNRPTLSGVLTRARADGQGSVLLARRHPVVVRELEFGRPVPGGTRGAFWRLGWRSPRAAASLATLLRGWFLVARVGGLRNRQRRLLGLLRFVAHWDGVRREVGGRDAFEAMVKAAPTAPADCCEREFDLADGFDALARLLASEPVDALRLRWCGHPVGRIPPRPAAEALRPIHVRAALLDDLAPAALAALGPGQ